MIDNFDLWIQPFRRLGIKPGLDTVRNLLNRLGNPQDKIKVIHITGTNGKGTTATLLHDILVEGGYKTGLFMSPYLIRPEEMCTINKQTISTDKWLKLAETVDGHIKAMDQAGQELPTEYEIYAAMMYLYFYEEEVDYAIIEVAMGGANDCTNVILKPIMTIITAIDMDHQAFLGDTLLAIAKEKSGIMKAGCPLVLHPQKGDLMSFFNDKAKAMEVDLLCYDIDPDLTLKGDVMTFTYKGVEVKTSLMGIHQKQNIIGVLEALFYLKQKGQVHLSLSQIERGIEGVRLACRFEKSGQWIFDGAHNNASLLALKKTLEALKLYHLTAVIGVLGDKDTLEGFRALKAHIDQVVLLEPLNPRRCSNPVLEQSLRELGYDQIIPVETLEEAYDLGQKSQSTTIAFGSFYMVGPLRDYVLKTREKQ